MTKHVVGAADATIRLSGARGLAAAVPQLLGFEPSQSLVLMCLRAPRGRLGPLARVDLFPPDAVDPVAQLVACASRYAHAVALVCYHDGDRPACIDAVLDALDGANVPVLQVLSISRGVMRDATDPARFAADPGDAAPGADDRQSRDLAAAGAMAGRRVLPDRESLRASIAPPRGRRLFAARAAIERHCRDLADALAEEPVSAFRGALPRRADAAFARTLQVHRWSRSVPVGPAAELIVLAGDIRSRDLLVARAVGCEDPDVVAMLIAVAAWCPDESAAEICAVLAVAAYRYGDGALAQCAVDRVLSVRPDHRLAHLMLAIMAACLPPAELATMAEIASEPDAGGDGGCGCDDYLEDDYPEGGDDMDDDMDADGDGDGGPRPASAGAG